MRLVKKFSKLLRNDAKYKNNFSLYYLLSTKNMLYFNRYIATRSLFSFQKVSAFFKEIFYNAIIISDL